ncbi:MAG: homoserine kinase, partial [Flavobacterium sp.]
PCLLGGFTLIRGYSPLDVIRIDSPNDLFAVILHPNIEVKTSDARAVLQPMIPLKDTITQTGNLGGLIAGLYTSDYDLISRSLIDVIIEPLRKHLIPYFDDVKNTAIRNGALGSGISGAGPSIFALCRGLKIAQKVSHAMQEYYQNTGIEFEVHISKINPNGVTEIKN